MGCKLSKVYKIEIILENKERVYHPGDSIVGQILIQVDEDTIIHNCSIECIGSARTKWPSSKENLKKSSLGYFSNFSINEKDRLFTKSDSIHGEQITDIEYRKFVINKSTSLLANIIDPGEVISEKNQQQQSINNTLCSNDFALINQFQAKCLGKIDDSSFQGKEIKFDDLLTGQNSEQSFTFYRDKIDLLKNYGSMSQRTDGILNQSSTSQSRSSSYLESLSSPKRPEFLISRGIHLFKFDIHLPSHLPSSFSLPREYSSDEIIANIRYSLKVIISNSDVNVTHTKEMDFVIYRPLDLRIIPRIKDRVTIHKEFMIPGCWGFSNRAGGSIKCDFSLNKTGFVPGETIFPEIFLNNSSSKNIETITLRFLQIILLIGRNNDHHIEVLRLFSTRLTSKNRTNKSSFEHVQLHIKPKVISNTCLVSSKKQKNQYRECALAGFGSTAEFIDKIHIPPVPCSGLEGNQSFVHIEYAVVLKMRLEGEKTSNSELRVNIPVTIGSEPTKETSFNESESVLPCYGRFDYKTGEVIEHEAVKRSPEEPSAANDDSRYMEPVYKYYKPDLTHTEERHRTSRSGRKSSSRRMNSNTSQKRNLTSQKNQIFSDESDPFLPKSLSTLDLNNEAEYQGRFPTKTYESDEEDSYQNSDEEEDDSDESEASSLTSQQSTTSSVSDSVIQDGLVDKNVNQRLLKNLYLKNLTLKEEINSSTSYENSPQKRNSSVNKQRIPTVTSTISQRSSQSKRKTLQKIQNTSELASI